MTLKGARLAAEDATMQVDAMASHGASRRFPQPGIGLLNPNHPMRTPRVVSGI